MEPVTMTALASAAMGLVAPYVKDGVTAFSKKFGETVGAATAGSVGRLWQAIKGKLDGEAVAGIEAKPEDTRRHAALELQLEEALEADPAFAGQVKALLDEVEKSSGKPVGDVIEQTANVTGDGNKVAQIGKGTGNTVNIS
jgi:hypothetical protein